MSVATAPEVTRAAILPGAVPSLDWLLREEPGEDDVIEAEFFERLHDRPVVEYSIPGWRHPPVRYPMLCTRGRMLIATFTIPVDQARGLLPGNGGERIRPVRVSPGRAPVLFFATDCQRGGLGSYREWGMALPVLLDCGITLPLLPLVVENFRPQSWKGFGLFPVHLAIDGERALSAIASIAGISKSLSAAEVDFSEHCATVTVDGRQVAQLSAKPPVGPSRTSEFRFPYNTVAVADGRIVRSDHDTMAVGYKGKRGRGEVEIADGPGFGAIKDLDIGRHAHKVMVIERLNWISWGPEDQGAV